MTDKSKMNITIRGIDEEVWKSFVKRCRYHGVNAPEALNDILPTMLNKNLKVKK